MGLMKDEARTARPAPCSAWRLGQRQALTPLCHLISVFSFPAIFISAV